MRVIFAISIVAAVAVLSSMFLSPKAYAINSWTSGEFTWGNEKKVESDYLDTDCIAEEVHVSGMEAPDKKAWVCVYDLTSWRYGFYTEITGPSYAPRHNTYLVVSLGSDSKMYKVSNFAPRAYETRVINEKDLIVNTLTMGFTNNHALSVIRNFPAQLTREMANGAVTYRVNLDKTEPLIPNDHGTATTTGAFGVSEDGRWLAAEVMGLGLVLLDAKSGQLNLFSNYKHWYGVGSDAHIHFVISQDGTKVAAFDYNIQPVIYTLSDDCMVSAKKIIEIQSRSQGYQSCPNDDGRLQTTLQEKYGTNGARFARASRFSYYADTLYFQRTEYHSDETMTVYDVPLRAGEYKEVRQLDYLALGDSISSGEGDTESRKSGGKYYRYPTDENGDKKKGIPKEKCHLSERSYPFLLAPAMNLGGIDLAPETVRWASVACSGAKTSDIIGRDSESYEGQNNGDKPRLQGFDVGQLKSEALAGFTPGRHKQMEFVKKYRPRAVTITAGANDIEFSRKLQVCVVRMDTYPPATEEGRKELAKEIQGLYDSLRATYREIYDRSDQSAKIFVVGYPRLIKDGKEVSDCPTSTKWINEEERLMINKATVYLNQVIRAAANSAGVYYLEGAQDSLIGHRLCEGKDLHVTAATIRVVGSDELQETFHPNAKGHEAIKKALWKSLSEESFAKFDVCPHTPSPNDINCPDREATAPDPDQEYFGDISTIKRTESRQMTLREIVKRILSPLSLLPFSFMPNTNVDVTVRSDPVHIGNYISGDSGELDIEIALPDNIPAGYHTLTLDGTGIDGQPVRYVQVIEVRGSDPGDIDEDGIPDHVDACMYIEPSYIDLDRDGIDDACDIEVIEKSDGANNVGSKDRSRNQSGSQTTTSQPAAFVQTRGVGSVSILGEDQKVDAVAPFGSQSTPLLRPGQSGKDAEETSQTTAKEIGGSYWWLAGIVVSVVITLLIWRQYAKRKNN